MPELPDVEIERRYFEAHALHQAVARTSVPAPDVLEATSPARLQHALKGHAFVETRRHGKHLFARFDGRQWLHLHFGMSGRLDYDEDDVRPAHACVVFHFRGHHRLAFVAPRRLGAVGLTADPRSVIEDRGLGPDALALSREAFLEAAAGTRRQAKAWLMDQSVLAGIGNVYSDEILFQAGIHPRRNLDELGEAERRALFETMHEVLEAAIEAQADPERMPEDWLLPHREDGARCPRCDGPVEQVDAAGRTARYCPRCQPAPGAG